MAIITQLTIQKKRAGRVNVFMDGTFFCGLEAETVMSHNLKVGQQISRSHIADIQFDSEKKTALERAARYLSASLKTQKQMQDFLNKKGYTEKVCDYVLEQLHHYHYLDDDNYAQQYLAAHEKSKGNRLIAYELRQKGIAQEIVEQCLSNDQPQEEACKNVLEKYMRNKSVDEKNKQKAFRYLCARGFSFDDIKLGWENFLTNLE